MSSIASLLVLASAAILFALAFLHLVITYRGPKLRPRDPALQAQMEAVSPVISRETTMWKTWIGFNGSHSIGGMLFGAIYGYLALAQSALLFRSIFLGSIGGLALVGYLILAIKYWFRIPLRGIALALILYVAGFAISFA